MHVHKPSDYCDPECPPLNWPALVSDLLNYMPEDDVTTTEGQKLKFLKERAEGYLKTNRRYGR